MHLIFIITLPARVIKHFKTNLYEENLKLRKQLTEAQKENTFLKKAAAFFAKELD